MPLNSHSQFWSGLETRSPLRDAAAYRRYLDKLRDLPRYFDEQTVNMRAGLKRGFSVSRVTLEGRDKSIEAFTDADAEKSPFRPFFSALPTEPPFSASYVQFRSGHSFIEEPDTANHCDGTLLPVAVISGSVWLRRNRSFVTLRKSSPLCPDPQTIRTIHYEALLRDELRLAF